MSSVILSGDTSGTITLDAPAVAGSNVVTLPAATGTVELIARDTAKTATGTSVDFTGIPAWAKRITVMFQGLSTTGSNPVIIQIGSGSFTDSGYLGAVDAFTTSPSVSSVTTGFGVTDQTATQIYHGAATILNINGNSWVSQALGGVSNAQALGIGGGSLSLGGTLDRVRITTVGGTDTFDAGTINVMWEG